MQGIDKIPNKCLDDANPILTMLWYQVNMKRICVCGKSTIKHSNMLHQHETIVVGQLKTNNVEININKKSMCRQM